MGVSGVIAAYKAADLASKLTGLGSVVHVIMTRSAGEFVRPLTFEALTGNPVYTDLFVMYRYDYVLINDKLEDTVAGILCILEAERSRSKRFSLPEGWNV